MAEWSEIDRMMLLGLTANQFEQNRMLADHERRRIWERDVEWFGELVREANPSMGLQDLSDRAAALTSFHHREKFYQSEREKGLGDMEWGRYAGLGLSVGVLVFAAGFFLVVCLSALVGLPTKAVVGMFPVAIIVGLLVAAEPGRRWRDRVPMGYFAKTYPVGTKVILPCGEVTINSEPTYTYDLHADFTVDYRGRVYVASTKDFRGDRSKRWVKLP